ncbi:CPBP family intramembrane glutamic endopeptidase [Risungbinella massiliensis]|uniref:CPBP family intramembrane glutamic endopeptidase n=1 Tax=Risungbinella massiliensis TaxID=1329796 RepID=UPI0005CBD873|nr:type II CAAX endopeptidase family protein [Risungbinella massiliensis]
MNWRIKLRDRLAILLFFIFCLMLYGEFVYVDVEFTTDGLWRFTSIPWEEELTGYRLLVDEMIWFSSIASLFILPVFLLLGFLSGFHQEWSYKQQVGAKEIFYLGAWSVFFLLLLSFSPYPDLAQLLFFFGIFGIGYWMFAFQPALVGLNKMVDGKRFFWRLPIYFCLLLMMQAILGGVVESIFQVDLYSEREESLDISLPSELEEEEIEEGPIEEDSIEEEVIPESDWSFIWSLAFICIGAPLGEEMLFRGYLQTYFSKWGKGIAILLSALLFSLYHVDVSSFLQIFGIGLLLGILKERHGSLWAPITLHFVNNLFASVVGFI